MPRAVTATLALIVVLAAVPGGAGTAQAVEAGFFAAAAQVDADDVVLRVDLTADGAAEWTVEYRVRLADGNDTAAFESLQADIEANRSAYTAQFAERMNRTVERAEDATGRPMAVSNVTVSATTRQLPQEYGVLAYSFTWEGFAVREDGTIRAGDAVAGLFLDEETTLLVSWPGGFGLVEAEPGTYERRDATLVWEGPLNFADGEPRIVVREGAIGGPGSPTPRDGTPASPGSPPGDGDGVPWSWLVAILVVLVLAGGGATYYLRSRSGDGDGGGDAGADAAAREDLLSNEERVLQLMAERGGRMKQQEVASALGWTDAKTSQVVGDLRDAGDLDGFRLGRENVLTLPEEESVDDAADEGDDVS